MKSYLLGLCLFLCSPAFSSANTFAASHGPHSSISILIFPTDSSREVYQDFPTAIEILEVVADGKTVKGAIRYSAGPANLMETDVGDARMVYSRLAIDLASYTDPKKSKEIVTYDDIDPKAKLIVVRYRVRLPRGKISDVHELRSTLENTRPN